MPKSFTLTTGNTLVAGPFPPNYPPGAHGYTGAQSNPSADFAGVMSSVAYYGATLVALANEQAVAPTQFMVAFLGTFDQMFLGDVTTPDGKTYQAINSSFNIYQIGVNSVSTWIWALASGGSALANGTVVIGDTGDTLVNLEGESHSSTQIDLRWSNTGPTPPLNYDLYRGVAGATPTLYQTLAGTIVAYSDTGLTASQQYDYAVVAVYADGTAAASVQQTFFTPASGISATFNCDCSVPVPDGWTTDTLANLRRRVAITCGYASQANNLPSGAAIMIDEKLRTAQNQLYRQHKEFRNIRMFAWQMEPDQRYYGLKDDESDCGALDSMSVEWVGFEDLNQAWYYLIEGIDPTFYTRAQISTGWPTHYEIRQCIEIFPAPKSPYTLWIKGRFGLLPFTANDDVTTIDAESIYLLACGLYKSHYGQPDAGALLNQALNYTKGIVAGQHGTRRYVPRTRPQIPWTPPKFLPLGNGPA